MNLRSTLILGALLPALASSAAAQVVPEPFEHCVVQIGNRSTPVDEEGHWVIDDVRAGSEPARARLYCQDSTGSITRSGQSGLFSVVPDQTSGVPELPFGNLESTPTRIELVAETDALQGDGATTLLLVTGHYGDASTKDLTVGATGTTYTSSNPGVLSVSADGLATAQTSGRALVSATHEGVTATVMLEVTAGGDSDGDGLPDDYELLVGLNPNDPLDALADHDGDGLNALEEYAVGSDPFKVDTDGDGLSDGEETEAGADGYVTDPLLADSDGDLVLDGEENQVGTDPTDGLDYDLEAVVVSLQARPTLVVMLLNPLLPVASAQLTVVGVTLSGRGIDLTPHVDTVYTDLTPGTVAPGDTSGSLEAITPGTTIIRVAAAGQSVDVPVEVRDSGPRPLSTLELGCYGNAVSLTDALVLVACGDGGLVLVDRSQPASPAVLATVATGATAWDVEVENNVAWLASGSTVARVALDDPGDVQVSATVSLDAAVLTVSVDGTLLVAGTEDSRVHVMDISGDEPTVLGDVEVPGVPRELDLVGGVATAALGVAGIAVVDANTLQVLSSVDVWNDQCNIDGFCGGDDYIRDVVYAPPYLYLAAHYRGLSVLDLSTPSAPVVLDPGSGSTQYMLEDLALAGGLMFGADLLRWNDIPIFTLSPPDAPVFQEVVAFPTWPEGEDGNAVAADQNLVVVTTRGNEAETSKQAEGNGLLQIGQWSGLDDVGNLAPVCGVLSPASPLGVYQGSEFFLEVSAIDDVMVDAVTIQWSGEQPMVDTVSPFSATLTAPVTPGVYSLIIEAIDLAGNVGPCDPVTVSVVADDTCQLGPEICDDESVCTDDSCEEGTGCVHVAIDCDDQDTCTNDTCEVGLGCQHSPIDCSDGLACTQDVCAPASGCAFLPVLCSDGSVCTTESCFEEAGGCVTTEWQDCDDGDLCTDPTCHPTNGCTQLSVNCDDLNPCTTDTCAPATGCESAPLQDGAPCGEDGVCVGGECGSQDINVFGFVATSAGAPVANAVVTVSPGGDPVLTDAGGYFETYSSAEEAVVQIRASGHSTAYMTVEPSAGAVLVARVKPVCGIFQLDLSQGAPTPEPVGCGGVTLNQVVGSLLLPDGTDWTGTVQVEIASVQTMKTQDPLYPEATDAHAMAAHGDTRVIPVDLRQGGEVPHPIDLEAGFEVRLLSVPGDGLAEPLRLADTGELHLEHTVWTSGSGKGNGDQAQACSMAYLAYDPETGDYEPSATGNGAYGTTTDGVQWPDFHKCTVNLVVNQPGWYTTPDHLQATAGVGYCASGKVVDEAGEGVAGATVVVEQRLDPVNGWGNAHRPSRVAVTGEDGTYCYQYSYLIDPQVQALAVHPDGGLSRSAPVPYDPAAAGFGLYTCTPEPTSCVAQPDLVLSRGCVQGVLQDLTGAPVVDATVVTDEGAKTVTAADGTYCLPASPGLPVTLAVGTEAGPGYVAKRVEVSEGSAQCGEGGGCVQVPDWKPESSFSCLRGQVHPGPWGEPWTLSALETRGSVEVHPSSLPGGAALSSSPIEANGQFCVDLLSPGQSVALYAYMTQAQSKEPQDYVTWHSCAPVCGSAPWVNTPTFPEITVPSIPGDCSDCPNVLPTIPCGGDQTPFAPDEPSDLCQSVCGCGDECGTCAPEVNSCVGKCGTDNFEGQCSCQPDCVAKGTCCADFCEVTACGDTYPIECGTCADCQAGSCANLCGTPSNAGGCFCDEGCFNRGDCCLDVCDSCGIFYGNNQGCDLCSGCAQGSCANACGMWEFSLGCSCSGSFNEAGEYVLCFEAGTCCEDICDTCGESTFGPQCAAVEGTCAGRCPFDGWGATDYLPWASCQCDIYCFERGDCCQDICPECSGEGSIYYLSQCHTCEGCSPDSCANLCGVETTTWTGCTCDLECLEAGTCCSDVCSACTAEQYAECACPGCTTDSCAGRCGEPVSNGCRCDPSCVETGDCCDDFCDQCGGDNPLDCGLCDGCSPDSCVERCGVQGASGCGCDTDCWIRGDCCGDICEPCGTDNLQCGSCEGRCGQYTYPYMEPDLGICNCDSENSYFWDCVDICDACPGECGDPDPGDDF